MAAPVLIGTSGWVYPHWRHRFYPQTVPQPRRLELLRDADAGYVYFNNDAESAAIDDARILRDLLGG